MDWSQYMPFGWGAPPQTDAFGIPLGQPSNVPELHNPSPDVVSVPDDPAARALMLARHSGMDPVTLAMGFVGGVKSELPMDIASRMTRAAEQGYTVDAYKGAYPYNWDTGAAITEFNTPDRPYAGYFTSEPQVAERFLPPEGGGAVFPVKLRFANPTIIDMNGAPAAASQFESIAREHGLTKAYEQFQNALHDKNVDGVILHNTADEGTVFVPKSPSQVRSRFADFDPANIGKSGLSYGAAGLTIPFGFAIPQQGR